MLVMEDSLSLIKIVQVAGINLILFFNLCFNLDIGSWTYNTSYLDLYNSSHEADTKNYTSKIQVIKIK